MATAKKTPVSPAKSTSTEVANWDEELALAADASAKMESSTTTGAMFSIKSGVLSWNDSPIENNQMAVVITDAILENVAYESDFDADNPSPPRCFAFGRVSEDMRPFSTVIALGQQVNDTCAGCEYNKFGTADKGRGKKCRNIRRLAIIPAGMLDGHGKFTMEKDPASFDTATMGFMKLPVTSTTGFAAYVKMLAATMRRPPHGVFTKIKVVPDAKSQFKVLFEPLGLIPNSIMGKVIERHKEAVGSIEQPYNLDLEEEKPAAKGKAKAPIRGKKF